MMTGWAGVLAQPFHAFAPECEARRDHKLHHQCSDHAGARPADLHNRIEARKSTNNNDRRQHPCAWPMRFDGRNTAPEAEADPEQKPRKIPAMATEIAAHLRVRIENVEPIETTGEASADRDQSQDRDGALQGPAFIRR